MENVDEKMSYYTDQNVFGLDQLEQIKRGLEFEVDVSLYAKPQFSKQQMMEIMNGLRLGLNVSWYADPAFSLDQMETIKGGLEDGLDVSLYAKPELPVEEMDRIYDILIQQQDEDMENIKKILNL